MTTTHLAPRRESWRALATGGAEQSNEAAKVAGMGAIPHAGGVAFRVWAPQASQVFVAGTFNNYTPDSHALVREEHGYWSINVPEAMPGDTYKFRIINGTLDIWRIDPYAREVTNTVGKTVQHALRVINGNYDTWRITPYLRGVTNSIGEAVVHSPKFDWDTQEYHSPAWHELVIYELHIGTFHVLAGAQHGTFDSAIERLPYLRDLGINCVLVMPPMEFSGDISWGYNPAHPFAIEAAYGGPLAFKRFVQAAHQQHIAVVLDVVYNHFGPGDLDLWQFDGWSENNLGGVYFYNDERAQTPWGATRPDYGRSEVRQYLRDNALMWLEEYRVDGLRFDATAYIRNWSGDDNPAHDLEDGWSLLRWINDEIDQRQPWKIMIAEDLRGNAAITAPTAEGGAGFDAQWDAGFVHPVRAALVALADEQRDIGAVAAAIDGRYNDDAFKRVIYTESHDEVANGKARVPHEIAPQDTTNIFAKKRSTLGAGLVLTAPGVPLIFQGQELLEDGWFDDRRPLNWEKLHHHPGINLLYRDLLRLRRNGSGTTRGLSGQYSVVCHASERTKVLAFHRWHAGGPNDSVVVVANLAGEARQDYWIGMPAAGLWQVRFNSDWSGYDEAFGNTMTLDVVAVPEPWDAQPYRAAINIGAYALVIFSLA